MSDLPPSAFILVIWKPARALPFACGLPCIGDPRVADSLMSDTLQFVVARERCHLDVNDTRFIKHRKLEVYQTSKNYLTFAAGSNNVWLRTTPNSVPELTTAS